MRRHAFRPEAPRSLEDRSLLAGGGAGPLVFSRHDFDRFTDRVRLDFQLYSQIGDVSYLQDQIQEVTARVSFGRPTGLNATVNSILRTMREGMNDGAPHPIFTARNQVIAAIRQSVRTSAQDGVIILR